MDEKWNKEGIEGLSKLAKEEISFVPVDLFLSRNRKILADPDLFKFDMRKVKKDHFAMIEVYGSITDASNDFISDFGSATRFKKFLKMAQDNKHCKGIIFRVDSPRGGAYPSEDMARAILEFKDQTGKPVIASMGNVCEKWWLFYFCCCR